MGKKRSVFRSQCTPQAPCHFVVSYWTNTEPSSLLACQGLTYQSHFILDRHHVDSLEWCWLGAKTFEPLPVEQLEESSMCIRSHYVSPHGLQQVVALIQTEEKQAEEVGTKGSYYPLASLMARGNTQGLIPSSGPLGKTYHDSRKRAWLLALPHSLPLFLE